MALPKATIKNDTICAEVLDGLSQEQKQLPSKLFYDERGSKLFEAICELDEYYLIDAENKIMRQNIDEIIHLLGKQVKLIELGSGSSTKTRLLLDNLHDIHSYVPVDISKDFLATVTNKLRKEYPNLTITPVAADYTQPFELSDSGTSVKKVAYYPGSTIGNFIPGKAETFLKLIADVIGSDGGLLIGFDLKKDKATLEAAYDDADGVTATFNKNILLRLNRELGADFDLDQFKHRAFFNEKESRIEMHLISRTEQRIHIAGTEFLLAEGESIHTENSYKYSREAFRNLSSAYFNTAQSWTDLQRRFCVQYLKPK